MTARPLTPEAELLALLEEAHDAVARGCEQVGEELASYDLKAATRALQLAVEVISIAGALRVAADRAAARLAADRLNARRKADRLIWFDRETGQWRGGRR